MSLKSVELQVAIHRTGDAGHMQNQLLQKTVHDQTMLAAAAAKQMEQMRKKSEALNKTEDDVKTERDGHNRSAEHGDRERKEHRGEERDTIEHPYKGHHIDYSL